VGKIYPLVWMVFFYPVIVGAAMVWAIPFLIALAVIAVRVGLRLGKYNFFRYFWFLLAVYIGLLPVLGFIGDDVYTNWRASIRKDNCGVLIGMTKVEVEKLANSCGQAQEFSEGYVLKPRGLGKLRINFGVCGLNVRYDDKGKVSQVNGWCD